jgi:EAL domain-containing protein (putative c-di-GMP-specific phosphodiesterase class I)
MIIDLGYFVFEIACRDYMSWKEQGLEIDTVSVNISSVQFREENLFENFKKIIDNEGISPHNIEIEITEHFIMEYSTANLTILDDFRAIGCRISIDDFGTGYSSMSYMKRLPLDTIKIDKSFIMDLPHNVHDVEVSTAIIALSKSLGYQVVAEGIEDELQEEFLRERKCDIGQGYYFARPMDSSAFVAFVKERI